MKRVLAPAGALSFLLILGSAPGLGDVAIAHPPKSSCFSTFLACRQYCVNTYAPNEGDPFVFNQQANACLLDCDVDVARCVFEQIGGSILQLKDGATSE